MVFFYAGLHCCLHGVQEQSDLKFEQLIHHPPEVEVYDSDVYYEYVELISKTNQHRFKDINMKNKTKSLCSCFVKMLNFYKTKLPKGILFMITE